jgi:flagellar biosynthesis anti-sigma factor FlgM
MKVNPKPSGSLQGVESTKTGKLSSKGGSEKSSATGASGIGSSKVDVSERAQMMQKAKDIASNDSVDEAKVARLQKMIDEGNYKTDASTIADRLVDEHMNFPE